MVTCPASPVARPRPTAIAGRPVDLIPSGEIADGETGHRLTSPSGPEPITRRRVAVEWSGGRADRLVHTSAIPVAEV